MNISMRFDIVAGRYEDRDEKNYKYCDSADTIEDAIAKWRRCEGYDFAEMELVVECDGARSRIAIFGGQDEETWMRMRIAGLWMKAMNKSFADIVAPWEEQLDEIEAAFEVRPCLRSQWQDVHAKFVAHQLTWTQSFDALMSQCGMPMEEALKCLAEHFDRRPVIRETEVAA